MKKAYIFILAIAAFSGCEKYYDIDTSGLKDKLYVNCLSSGKDTTFINIAKCVNINSKESDTALDIQTLELEIDGNTYQAEEYSSKSIFNCWIVKAPFVQGATARLEVKAKGYPVANASYSIPYKPAIRKISHNRNIFNDYYEDFEIEMEELPSGDKGHYGITVKRIVEVYGSDTGEHFYTETFQEWIESKIKGEGNGVFEIDNEDFFRIDFGGNVLYYSYVYRDEASEENLFLPTSVTKEDNKLEFSIYRQDGTGFDSYFPGYGGPVELPIDIKSRYLIKIYRVSEDFYDYAKAQYYSSENAFSELGLSPSRAAYKNINGGYGIAAAYACTDEIEVALDE